MPCLGNDPPRFALLVRFFGRLGVGRLVALRVVLTRVFLRVMLGMTSAVSPAMMRLEQCDHRSGMLFTRNERKRQRADNEEGKPFHRAES